MISLILIIFASLIPFAVTWITTPGEIFIEKGEKKKKEIFRRRTGKIISVKGYWFIGAILLTGTLAFLQYKQSESDKRVLKIERDKRDSIITSRINAGVDSNRRVLYNDLSLALAKQSLTLDTVSKKLRSLGKPSQNTNTIIQQPDPLFGICAWEHGINLTEKNDALHKISLSISYCHSNSPSNVKLQLFFLYPENGIFKRINKVPLIFEKKGGLEQDGAFEDQISLTTSGLPSKLFLYIRGQYTNFKKNKAFKIDDVSVLDITMNKAAFTSDKIKQDIRKMFD
jgi:hypothetical protein